MNRRIVKLSLALALCVLFALPPSSLAADPPQHGARQQRPEGRRARRPDRLQVLKQRLNLTADQVEKIKPILKDEQDQIRALRQDSSLQRPQRAAKLRAIRADSLAKIKAVLTPEQVEKFNKLQQRPRRQHPNRNAPQGR